MSDRKTSPVEKDAPVEGAARFLPHSMASKVCIVAGAALIACAGIAVAACGTEAGPDEGEQAAAERSIEDFDFADDGEVDEAAIEYDSEAVVNQVIYEGRAVDLRVSATRAAAGIGGGEIDLRVANESSSPLVVELIDMSVAGEGVAGAGRAECGAMQIVQGSVSFVGAGITEVDDLDLWHATVRVLTPDGDVIETGTASLAGAFD